MIQSEYIIPHYPSPCPPVSSVPASLLINSRNVRLSNEVLPLKCRRSLSHQKAYLCRDDGFIFLSAVKITAYLFQVVRGAVSTAGRGTKLPRTITSFVSCGFVGKKSTFFMLFWGMKMQKRRKYSHLSCHFNSKIYSSLKET